MQFRSLVILLCGLLFLFDECKDTLAGGRPADGCIVCRVEALFYAHAFRTCRWAKLYNFEASLIRWRWSDRREHDNVVSATRRFFDENAVYKRQSGIVGMIPRWVIRLRVQQFSRFAWIRSSSMPAQPKLSSLNARNKIQIGQTFSSQQIERHTQLPVTVRRRRRRNASTTQPQPHATILPPISNATII